MIQKFKQFVNEAVDNDQRPLSVHDAINKPYAEFIERAQERLEMYTERIAKLLHDMDVAIEEAQDYLSDVIVGEPIIKVDETFLNDITVQFRTNIPNTEEAWEADKNPALDLERRVNELLDTRNEAMAEIYYKPDEDGNCIIELSISVIREKNFGEYTETLTKLGEDW